MSKSVSNDALWEKLSEIEEKISKSLIEQKAPVQVQKQSNLTPEIKASKDEIVKKLEKYIQGLGTHCDKHFKFLQTQFDKLYNDMADTIACLVHLIKESEKQQDSKSEHAIQESKKSYFNFKFFKIRKTAITIILLGILVFTLTLFCMKQQNDYSLLMDEYFRQGIELREIHIGRDSLSVVNLNTKKK
jgi:hypothetical protein